MGIFSKRLSRSPAISPERRALDAFKEIYDSEQSRQVETNPQAAARMDVHLEGIRLLGQLTNFLSIEATATIDRYRVPPLLAPTAEMTAVEIVDYCHEQKLGGLVVRMPWQQ